MIRRPGRLGGYYAVSLEFARFGRGGHRGRAMIPRGGHLGVTAGRAGLLHLTGQRRRVLLAGIGFLASSRASLNSAFTAIKGNVRLVVHDDFAVHVDVPDLSGVHIHDGCVVEESPAAPFAAIKAFTAIAEAVVNATVESDFRAPVAGIPDVNTVSPAPVAGSPQQADGSDHPGPGHPVVADVVAPRPVAGSPEIAGPGTERLLVNRQRRR